MLAELKFVMGAVSKKDFLPALTHFRIENNTVRSFNGTLALCTPIALSIDCTPKAEPLVKAIQNCDETVTLTLTPTGRLSIKSGSFRAVIECVQEETPHVVPEGEEFPIDGEALLKAVQALAPLVGDDASRPWSNGLLLRGASAFATNNVVLAEYWIGSHFPVHCNVPRAAIKEMLRINEAPIKAQVTDKNITFHYTDGRWLRTVLLETKWPDIERILTQESSQQPIDEALFAALEKLKPFADKMGRVFFRQGELKTHLEEDGSGASVTVESITAEGVYQIEKLAMLQGLATSIDFNTYPSPCMFRGERVRGAIIGMRQNLP